MWFSVLHAEVCLCCYFTIFMGSKKQNPTTPVGSDCQNAGTLQVQLSVRLKVRRSVQVFKICVTIMCVSSERESEHSAGKLDPAPPISAEQVHQVLIGRMKGIQGHYNSCYMDAALFRSGGGAVMFTCTPAHWNQPPACFRLDSGL